MSDIKAAKQLTAEEWKEIEEELKLIYSMVKLRCDGYEVSITLARVTQFKNAIVVYVNGVVKGEWLLKECEESRRFFRKVTKSVLTPKQKKSLQKLPKKLQKELGIDKTVSYYLADWTSFRALKKHLIEHNQSIELIQSKK